MSIGTLLVILLVWAIAGLLAAIAFGKAIQESDTSPDEEEPVPNHTGTIGYLRRNKRKADTQQTSNARMRGNTMKRTAG